MANWDEQRDIASEGQRAAIYHGKKAKTNRDRVRLNIGASELDIALKKAERLSAMLDEIEERFSTIDTTGNIVAAPTVSPPPPKPR